MKDFVEETKMIISRAQQIHALEKTLTIESVELVSQLERRKAACMCGLPAERFAEHIGLTINQYWKRAAAARVIDRFGEARAMLKNGETSLSHLALISAKITEANSDLLLAGIKHKPRRHVEGLLSRITPDGDLLEQEEEVDIRVKLKASQLALLDRAKAVLSHGGHVPAVDEILQEALSDLLEKRDPMLKAKRAAERREKSLGKQPAKASSSSPGQDVNSTSPGQGVNSTSPGQGRAAVKAEVRHEVWLRDKGQCSHQFPDGSRCEATLMIELDHKVLFCRGGEATADNLRLMCRYHNQATAEAQLGQHYMAQKRRKSPRQEPSAWQP